MVEMRCWNTSHAKRAFCRLSMTTCGLLLALRTPKASPARLTSVMVPRGDIQGLADNLTVRPALEYVARAGEQEAHSW